jgi:hypothetical protein
MQRYLMRMTVNSGCTSSVEGRETETGKMVKQLTLPFGEVKGDSPKTTEVRCLGVGKIPSGRSWYHTTSIRTSRPPVILSVD